MSTALLNGTGVYEEWNGYHWAGEHLIDRESFGRAVCGLGRVEGPALLYDLVYEGTLDLSERGMVGVVAEVWSDAEYPENSLEVGDWCHFFRQNGYTADGRATSAPQRVTLYRGAPEDRCRRMAWTAELAVAQEFAYSGMRGRPRGVVWTAEVVSEHLLAFIHEGGRREAEFVVDPSGLSGIRRWGG